MSEVVLDASALLALLHREPGHEEVADTIPHAAISSVNLSEVVAKLAENGMPEAQVREALAGLALDVHDFDAGDAFRAGFLRPATKEKGAFLWGSGMSRARSGFEPARAHGGQNLAKPRFRGESSPDPLAGCVSGLRYAPSTVDISFSVRP